MNKFNKLKDSSLILGDWKLVTLPPEILYIKLREIPKMHPNHLCFRVLHEYVLSIHSPEDSEIFLSTKQHNTKSDIYVIFKNWLQSGLILSSGEKWAQRRKILTPAFHFNILKQFVDVFNEEADKFSEIIEKKSSEPINIPTLLFNFALNVLNETVMGYKLDSTIESQKYRKAVLDINNEVLVYRIVRPWLYKNWLYIFTSTYRKERRLVKILHNFSRNIIKERMENFANITDDDFNDNETNDLYATKKKKRLAMLDILIQAYKDGGQIDYEGICEEVDNFMFAGHDTTASASSFCLMLIANHPEIQEQIYQEIKSIIGEKEKPDYSDYQKMDLLERCIKESSRIYPILHFISRWCEKETILHTGHIVPKNTRILISIIDIHHDPKNFPNPEKFDPDRFLPENCKGRHPYAYLPFSVGQRNCLGQRYAMLEMKCLIAGLLLKFKLTPIDTPQTIVVLVQGLLKTKDGIRIKFNRRE